VKFTASVQGLRFFFPIMTARLLLRRVATAAKATYLPAEAIALARAYALAPFDETVEIAMNLLVNPRRGDQLVRGSCFLPKGLGKTVKLGVFTSETYAAQALAAGADIAGDALIAMVEKGQADFEKVLATSEMVAQLKKYGKLLGPKGLMPSAKVGTVVDIFNLDEAIKKAKEGQVTFRVEESGVLHAAIGKASFSIENLVANYLALVQEVNRLRPASLKGKYVASAYLKTTHGPAWRLAAEAIDSKAKGSIL